MAKLVQRRRGSTADHNNFIGSLLQKNNKQPNWIDFLSIKE